MPDNATKIKKPVSTGIKPPVDTSPSLPKQTVLNKPTPTKLQTASIEPIVKIDRGLELRPPVVKTQLNPKKNTKLNPPKPSSYISESLPEDRIVVPEKEVIEQPEEVIEQPEEAFQLPDLEEQSPKAYKIAEKIIGNFEDANDVVNRVYGRLRENPELYTGEVTFANFLRELVTAEALETKSNPKVVKETPEFDLEEELVSHGKEIKDGRVEDEPDEFKNVDSELSIWIQDQVNELQKFANTAYDTEADKPTLKNKYSEYKSLKEKTEQKIRHMKLSPAGKYIAMSVFNWGMHRLRIDKFYPNATVTKGRVSDPPVVVTPEIVDHFRMKFNLRKRTQEAFPELSKQVLQKLPLNPHVGEYAKIFERNKVNVNDLPIPMLNNLLRLPLEDVDKSVRLIKRVQGQVWEIETSTGVSNRGTVRRVKAVSREKAIAEFNKKYFSYGKVISAKRVDQDNLLIAYSPKMLSALVNSPVRDYIKMDGIEVLSKHPGWEKELTKRDDVFSAIRGWKLCDTPSQNNPITINSPKIAKFVGEIESGYQKMAALIAINEFYTSPEYMNFMAYEGGQYDESPETAQKLRQKEEDHFYPLYDEVVKRPKAEIYAEAQKISAAKGRFYNKQNLSRIFSDWFLDAIGPQDVYIIVRGFSDISDNEGVYPQGMARTIKNLHGLSSKALVGALDWLRSQRDTKKKKKIKSDPYDAYDAWTHIETDNGEYDIFEDKAPLYALRLAATFGNKWKLWLEKSNPFQKNAIQVIPTQRVIYDDGPDGSYISIDWDELRKLLSTKGYDKISNVFNELNDIKVIENRIGEFVNVPNRDLTSELLPMLNKLFLRCIQYGLVNKSWIHDSTFFLPNEKIDPKLQDYLLKNASKDVSKQPNEIRIIIDNWHTVEPGEENLSIRDLAAELKARVLYKDVTNKSIAVEAAKWGISEHDFPAIQKGFIESLKVPDFLPGKIYTNDKYVAYFMRRDDPRGLFLGQYTNCCQYPGGAGGSCAWYGQKDRNSGFFVIEDTESKEILAQSWTWTSPSGLCFDNVEAKGLGDREKVVIDLYEQAANDLVKKYGTVNVGKGLGDLKLDQWKPTEVPMAISVEFDYWDLDGGRRIINTSEVEEELQNLGYSEDESQELSYELEMTYISDYNATGELSKIRRVKNKWEQFVINSPKAKKPLVKDTRIVAEQVYVHKPENYGGGYSDAKEQVTVAHDSNFKPPEVPSSIVGLNESDNEGVKYIAEKVYPEGWQHVDYDEITKAKGVLVNPGTPNERLVGYVLLDGKNREVLDMAILPEFKKYGSKLVNSFISEITDNEWWTATCRESTSCKLLRAYAKRGRIELEELEVEDKMGNDNMINVKFRKK